jgi:penicillin-binding protein 2
MSGNQPAFEPFRLALRGVAVRNGLAVVFGLLLVAFFRLQVMQHDRYRLKSESNRLRPVPVPAPRGLILDRHGAVIAENVPGHSVAILANSEASLRSMLARLSPLLPLDSEAVSRAVARFRGAPYEPALLVKDAPFALVSTLEERRTELPGLVIQTEPKREYPDGAAVAHLVGYVGEVTDQELAGADSLRRPGTIVGRQGLEREYDSTLAGSDGIRFVEVDALGRVVRDEGAVSLAPVPGHALHTTIDLALQRYVASVFPAGRRGAVVAMDPRTGDILALYSSPSYDPNAFVGGIDRATWNALNTDPARPLLDRAIAARYPPASTFKLAIAVMALQRGLVDFDSRMPLPCRGGIWFGTRFFRCWKPEGHGSLTLAQAIAESCDSYFYQLGLKLGVPALLAGGVALGFDSLTDIDLPGELGPAYPSSTAYYDRIYGRGGWTGAVALNLAIGQGENAQTLINMVRFYAALANGGRLPRPHIIAEPEQSASAVQLPDSVFAGLRQALLAVVEEGTARGARLKQLAIAGKTGSAQNPHGPDHGWFIGFAPAGHAEIVVGAIVENALHGASIAPMVAGVIERYLLGPDAAAPGGARVVPLRVPRDTVTAPARPAAGRRVEGGR